jgi:NitT/TauT family transport system substrate-binding protein
MMKRTLSIFGLVAALAFSGSLAASQAQDAMLVPIKVGTLKMAALTDVWVAKQAKIFEQNGLDAQLVEFRNGNEAIAAHRGGDVDFVLSIPGTAMTALERGFDLVLVAQNEVAKDQAPDAGAIIALKDSGLNSLADLAGKQIAVSGLHSQMHVAALKALKNAGVDVSTVQSVEVPFASQIDALKARKVDAVAELDPWTTVLRSSGVAKVLGWTYVDSVPGQPIGAWYVSSAFAKKNPDIVRRFAESIRDSIAYMQADPQRARQNVAAYTGLDPALVKDMPINEWDYTIKPASWQATVDMMVEMGVMDHPHKAAEYFSEFVQPYVAR